MSGMIPNLCPLRRSDQARDSLPAGGSRCPQCHQSTSMQTHDLGDSNKLFTTQEPYEKSSL